MPTTSYFVIGKKNLKLEAKGCCQFLRTDPTNSTKRIAVKKRGDSKTLSIRMIQWWVNFLKEVGLEAEVEGWVTVQSPKKFLPKLAKGGKLVYEGNQWWVGIP